MYKIYNKLAILLFSLFLFPLPVLGLTTTETVISTVSLSECLIQQTVDVQTTQDKLVYQSIVGTAPERGTGYSGGQSGRYVKCPEDCDDTIIIGNAMNTRIDDVMQNIQWTEHSTVLHFVDTCKNCDKVVTPETNTLILIIFPFLWWMMGIMRSKDICTIAVPSEDEICKRVRI